METKEKFQVFVYGTLKSGNKVRGLDQPIYIYDEDRQSPTYGQPIEEIEKELIGKATTTDKKFSMVDLGSFPGVIQNGYHDVYGEVYAGGQDFLDYCDKIEGHQGDKAKNFYHRDLVNTTEGKAFIYYLDPYYSEYDDHKTSNDISLKNGILNWLR
tara:strand:+ start:3286 stop:3753 length:468 start_codon:yes stop_codon:yes gene_type:complete